MGFCCEVNAKTLLQIFISVIIMFCVHCRENLECLRGVQGAIHYCFSCGKNLWLMPGNGEFRVEGNISIAFIIHVESISMLNLFICIYHKACIIFTPFTNPCMPTEKG